MRAKHVLTIITACAILALLLGVIIRLYTDAMPESDSVGIAMPFNDSDDLHERYGKIKHNIRIEVRQKPSYPFSSVELYSATNSFDSLLALGDQVVPLLIDDLKRGENDFQRIALRAILKDRVRLDTLYNDPDAYSSDVRHRELWLRWWEDTGSKKAWSNAPNLQSKP